MSFDLQNLATIGGGQIDAPTMYTYKTSDVLGTVLAVGYFVDKQFEFELGDMIFALLPQGHVMLEVLADTSTVKIIDIAQSDIQQIIDTATNHTQSVNDDVIFATASLTVTMLDPTIAYKPITIRSITGTTTISASTGTVETSSLTAGTSITMAPRASGWFAI